MCSPIMSLSRSVPRYLFSSTHSRGANQEVGSIWRCKHDRHLLQVPKPTPPHQYTANTPHRKGLYPLKVFPSILGTEISGTVVSLPTSPTVLSDPTYKARNYHLGQKVVAYQVGAFSTYVSVPWHKVPPIPDNLELKTAAAALVQATTTVTFMDEAYDVQKGDTVLVHTIAGGLGLVMLQYAKYKGATVIGTTSTKEKAELAKSLGCDHVILYKDEDVVKRVLEITNGLGCEAIFDGVGKDTFESDFLMIKRKGTLLTLGNTSGAVPPVSPLKLVEKNVKLMRPTMANYVYTSEEVNHYGEKVFGLVADGTLKIKVWKEYGFEAEDVRQAQRDLTGGKTVGKLVIKIGGEAA